MNNTTNARALIRKRELIRTGRNTTRLYNHIVPIQNGEARIDTYAVKTHTLKKGDKLVIVKVARYYTDRNDYYLSGRVLRNNFTNAICINWADKPFGRKHIAIWSNVDASINSWSKEKYSFGKQVWIWGDWLNDFAGTKYEHCGYNPHRYNHLNILQYLQCWNINHAVSFLYNDYKHYMERFISPPFIRRLTSNADFFKLFRSSNKTLSEHLEYGIKTLTRAFKYNEPLADAHFMVSNFFAIRDYSKHIPKIVDRKQLFHYFERTGVEVWTYSEYCQHLAKLQIDIDAHGMMFPTHNTMDRVNEQYQVVMENERRIEYKKRKAQERREARERLARWKRICLAIAELDRSASYLTDYNLVFPKNNNEMKAEGKRMMNCIGATYRYNQYENIICFLKQGDKSYADIRIDPTTFKVMEARLRKNIDAPKEIYDIAENIATNLKNAYRKVA